MEDFQVLDCWSDETRSDILCTKPLIEKIIASLIYNENNHEL